MDILLFEYLPIIIFLGIAIVLSGIFIGGSFLIASQRPDFEKTSAYECGFDAFDDARVLTIGFIYEWRKGALEWE